MNAHLCSAQHRRILVLTGILCLFGLTAFGASSTVALISRRSPDLIPKRAANGDSFLPVYSPDGSHLIFASRATDLAAPATSAERMNLYDYISSNKTVILLTAPPGGGPGRAGQSTPVGVLGDTLIFLSTASDLVPAVTNQVQQLYAQSLVTGARRLLSRDPVTGAPASSDIRYATAPALGHYVFFETAASEFSAGLDGTLNEIYRIDLADSDRIELASHIPQGTDAEIRAVSGFSTSADGTAASYVAFDQTNGPAVLVNNLAAGEVTTISAGGPPTRRDNYEATLSDDGAYLAIRCIGLSSSTNHGVYWVDLAAGQSALCSANLNGAFEGDYFSFAPLILFPGGKIVAFENTDTNYLSKNILFWSAEKGVFGMDGFLPYVPFVSTEPGDSSQPLLSPDGKRLAFHSTAANVVHGVDDGQNHLYVRELETGETFLISHDPRQQLISESTELQGDFSPDGLRLAFGSISHGYVDGDDNDGANVFETDVTTKMTGLISTASPNSNPAAADGGNSFLSKCLSRDGRYAVFSSTATDLIAGDANGASDIFLADLQNATLRLISSPTNGLASPYAVSSDAQISPNGRFILFQSTATNLASGQLMPRRNVYLYDGASQTIVLASPTNSVDTGDNSGQPSNLVMSADGRYVAYGAGDSSILRDIAAGTSMQIGIKGDARNAVLSADGQIAAFATRTGVSTEVLSTGNTLKLYTRGVSLSYLSPALSASGEVTGFVEPHSVPYPLFMLAGTLSGAVTQYPLTNLVSVTNWRMTPSASYAVFEGLVNDASGTFQLIYLDTKTGSQTVISTNLAGAFGNGNSRSPSISDDGRFVVFKSEASDLAASDQNDTQDIFIHDAFDGTTQLISHAASGNAASGRSVRSSISGDGSTVAFLSGAVDLANGVLNGTVQLFAASISAPSADTDGDGLPDAWEQHYFGNLNQGANDDPDHDGATNLQEFIAHTDPVDPQSVLKLAVSRLGETLLHLAWQTASGVKYQVQLRSSLGSTDWQNLGPIEFGTGEVLTRPLNPSPAGSQFFRLVIVE